VGISTLESSVLGKGGCIQAFGEALLQHAQWGRPSGTGAMWDKGWGWSRRSPQAWCHWTVKEKKGEHIGIG